MRDIVYQNKDVASKVTGEALVGKSLRPFGLPHLRITGLLPTNLPMVESNELRLDNLFLLSDGSVALMDYESKFSKENFVKYANYIARVMKRYALSRQLEELRELKMIVIYTADVEAAELVYDLGSMVIRVEPAYLIHLDSVEIYGRIKAKLEVGADLTEEELVELMILPLTQKGAEEKRKLITAAVGLAKGLKERSQTLQVLSGILTFTDKIIDERFREKIKEEMRMTQIGQMIFEDGVQEGIQRLNRLIELLASSNRTEDIVRAASDNDYQQKLFREFGL
ncbi:hypothetical protein [Lacrimispora sp. 210928-DFI.3.58]|uniref:hypothetical protein n=1 Tax=Lacrimispora sp. 210928-DFI.3.58 TaxID=2883214 RepID=UPI001D082178|nr:hypothetical protein [Lacrimispora sp. 210928-DFI.3.58]MCB7320134.1 hypothetical protein [Lacrimispora sp. 210928-DFI.3.58]